MSTASLRRAVRIGLVAAMALGAAGLARAQAPLVSHDFEDGTLQGWIPRGGTVVLENTTEAANGGTHSLKTTGRTAGFNGPSLDVFSVLQKDVVYLVRASVRLVAAEPQTRLKISVQRTPTGGSDAFDQVVGLTTVTDGAWVTLQGSYRFTTDVTALLLYVESESTTASFYVDDFQISLVPVDNTGFVSDFESGTFFGYTAADGSVRNWGPRGGMTLTNVTEDAHGGTHSLKATGRTATFMGPSINILGKMTKGFRYRISVWAKLAPGEVATNLRVSVQRTLGGVNNFDNVTANTQVTDGQWVLLSALYSMNADVDALSVYVETQTSTTASFYIDDFSLQFSPPKPIQTDIPSVKDVLAEDFFFGGAIEPNQVPDALHADLMKKHLSSLTAENAMKWGSIHPSEATYNFTGADTIANFARANGMTMRGHTLLWHSQNPAWLFQDAAGVELTPSPESKALVLQRLQDHIRTMIGRYGDVVSSWDVVNEVIDASQPDGLRRSRWYELTGTDFLDVAFQTARQEAPTARLCINDFSTTDTAKRQALLNVVQGMLARGVPVDCVGHQMHVNVAAPSVPAVQQTLQAFTDLGLDNQITEMDISVYTDSTSRYQVVPEEVLVQQGYRYRDIFKEFRRFKDSISSVTLWGIADDHTWLKSFPISRLDLPLLFDEELQAKHAYWGVVDPLHLPVLIQKKKVVEGTPRLEGLGLDPQWSTTGSTPIGEEGNAATATFKVLWNEHHLYVLADVEDATRNPHDQIEIYIDENNGKTTSYEPDDARYIFDRAGRGRGVGDFQFRINKRLRGYRIEAELPITRALAAGAEIGFDFRLVDADAGTKVAWNDFTLSQDTDTSKWGTLSLVGANQTTDAVKGTPVIDGVEDNLWAAATEFTTDTFVLGTSGSTARVKAMWDSGHIYVLAHVTDSLLSKASPNAYEQDSVEIFVDQNNGKTEAYEADDGQYRVNFENTQTFGGSASAANFVTATTIEPGGYLVEAAIALDAVELKIGTLIGFDVQVNNDELGNGVRSSVALWNDPTGESFRNTSRLGVLRMVRRPLRH